MARKPLIATILFAAVCTAALALAGGATIKVSVVTAEGSKPIQGGMVKLAGTTRFAVADAKGRAEITGLSAGTYTVICSAAGRESLRQGGVTIADGGTATLTCPLPIARATEHAQVEAQRKAEEARVRAAAKKAAERESRYMQAEERAAAPVADAPMAAAEPRPSRRPRVKRGKRKIAMGKPMGRRPPPRPRPKPAMIAGDAPRPPEMNTEEYKAMAEADFKSALQTPLSTFSIDVDTASYANARRFIEQQNKLPPRDAVRIEEFINYFTYDYPNPDGAHPFAMHTEVSTAPWNPKHRLVHIGVQGQRVDTAALPPANLVFLLDVSGSMNRANKLPLLKQAFRLLVDNLRPHDRVAIVVYAGAAGLVLPSTPGKQREKILDALDGLRAGGSTAGGAGIKLAYEIAKQNFVKDGNNRIILATDGDFNVGTSSEGELVKLIEEKRKSGVFLTILGFGSGNYKDSKMEMLSNKGNGNAAYIDSVLEAKKVLVTEMGGTLLTIAKDVKIQVEFNPARVKGYRLIGYENRALADRDFDDDTKDAGELGAGSSVTVLYEIIPADSDEPLPGVADLKYQAREISDAAKASPEMLNIKLRYKKPDGDKSTLVTQPLVDSHTPFAKTSESFRFSAAVATFAQLLRGSKYTQGTNLKTVIDMARSAEGEDVEGYRGGFVQLVRKAEAIGLPR